MGLIQRQLAWDVLRTFAIGLVATGLLMTFLGAAREAMRHHLPLPLVIECLPLLAPETLRFTIPGCLLFAATSAYGRFAAQGQLTAVRALGVSTWAVVWPVLCVAVLASLATFCLYDVCARWSRPALERLAVESVDDVAYSILKAQRSFVAQPLTIFVQDVREKELVAPLIVIEQGEDEPEIRLTADRASLEYRPESNSLQLVCWNGQIEVAGEAQVTMDRRFVYETPLASRELKSDESRSPAELPLSRMHAQWAFEHAKLAGLAESGRPNAAREMAARRERMHRLEAEGSRRLANGFGCLAFVMLGIPIAIWQRSADTMSTFFLCFLPVLFVYYPLLVAGESMARDGWFPPLSVWLATAVLAVAGAACYWKLIRH